MNKIHTAISDPFCRPFGTGFDVCNDEIIRPARLGLMDSTEEVCTKGCIDGIDFDVSNVDERVLAWSEEFEDIRRNFFVLERFSKLIAF